MTRRNSVLDAFDDDITQFLDSLYARHENKFPHHCNRPFVTLTYAQSLDGKIAGKGKKQVRLSGGESMRMTHQLRRRHDGIMVGIGTVLSDDPQLTARDVEIEVQHQPQPIIIDQNLQTPQTSRLITNSQAGIGKQPWLYASAPIESNTVLSLISSGATVSYSPPSSYGNRLDLSKVLSDLYRRGIRSLMIEGGASIISSFLSHRMSDGRPLVDLIIVTVAPVMIGPNGVGIPALDAQAPALQTITTKMLGKDAIFVCEPS